MTENQHIIGEHKGRIKMLREDVTANVGSSTMEIIDDLVKAEIELIKLDDTKPTQNEKESLLESVNYLKELSDIGVTLDEQSNQEHHVERLEHFIKSL